MINICVLEEYIPPAAYPKLKQVHEWCMDVFRFYNFNFNKTLIESMINTFQLMTMGLSYHE